MDRLSMIQYYMFQLNFDYQTASKLYEDYLLEQITKERSKKIKNILNE
jgi:hypothetical protein